MYNHPTIALELARQRQEAAHASAELMRRSRSRRRRPGAGRVLSALVGGRLREEAAAPAVPAPGLPDGSQLL